MRHASPLLTWLSMKKLLLVFLSLELLIVSSLAVSLSFDTRYDDPGASLATVACSDGANGLLTKGFTTFGSLPSFPNIGGAQAVTGWNSSACGTCWALSFRGSTIHVLAVDRAVTGFNVARAAMNNLTNGGADAFGRVEVDATPVNVAACGL